MMTTMMNSEDNQTNVMDTVNAVLMHEGDAVSGLTGNVTSCIVTNGEQDYNAVAGKSYALVTFSNPADPDMLGGHVFTRPNVLGTGASKFIQISEIGDDLPILNVNGQPVFNPTVDIASISAEGVTVSTISGLETTLVEAGTTDIRGIGTSLITSSRPAMADLGKTAALVRNALSMREETVPCKMESLIVGGRTPEYFDGHGIRPPQIGFEVVQSLSVPHTVALPDDADPARLQNTLLFNSVTHYPDAVRVELEVSVLATDNNPKTLEVQTAWAYVNNTTTQDQVFITTQSRSVMIEQHSGVRSSKSIDLLFDAPSGVAPRGKKTLVGVYLVDPSTTGYSLQVEEPPKYTFYRNTSERSDEHLAISVLNQYTGPFRHRYQAMVRFVPNNANSGLVNGLSRGKGRNFVDYDRVFQQMTLLLGRDHGLLARDVRLACAALLQPTQHLDDMLYSYEATGKYPNATEVAASLQGARYQPVEYAKSKWVKWLSKAGRAVWHVAKPLLRTAAKDVGRGMLGRGLLALEEASSQDTHQRPIPRRWIEPEPAISNDRWRMHGVEIEWASTGNQADLDRERAMDGDDGGYDYEDLLEDDEGFIKEEPVEMDAQKAAALKSQFAAGTLPISSDTGPGFVPKLDESFLGDVEAVLAANVPAGWQWPQAINNHTFISPDGDVEPEVPFKQNLDDFLRVGQAPFANPPSQTSRKRRGWGQFYLFPTVTKEGKVRLRSLFVCNDAIKGLRRPMMAVTTDQQKASWIVDQRLANTEPVLVLQNFIYSMPVAEAAKAYRSGKVHIYLDPFEQSPNVVDDTSWGLALYAAFSGMPTDWVYTGTLDGGKKPIWQGPMVGHLERKYSAVKEFMAKHPKMGIQGLCAIGGGDKSPDLLMGAQQAQAARGKSHQVNFGRYDLFHRWVATAAAANKALLLLQQGKFMALASNFEDARSKVEQLILDQAEARAIAQTYWEDPSKRPGKKQGNPEYEKHIAEIKSFNVEQTAYIAKKTAESMENKKPMQVHTIMDFQWAGETYPKGAYIPYSKDFLKPQFRGLLEEQYYHVSIPPPNKKQVLAGEKPIPFESFTPTIYVEENKNVISKTSVLLKNLKLRQEQRLKDGEQLSAHELQLRENLTKLQKPPPKESEDE